jgi:hypothetical protein
MNLVGEFKPQVPNSKSEISNLRFQIGNHLRLSRVAAAFTASTVLAELPIAAGSPVHHSQIHESYCRTSPCVPDAARYWPRGRRYEHCRPHPHCPLGWLRVFTQSGNREHDTSPGNHRSLPQFALPAVRASSAPVLPLSPASTQPVSPSNRTGQDPSGIQPVLTEDQLAAVFIASNQLTIFRSIVFDRWRTVIQQPTGKGRRSVIPTRAHLRRQVRHPFSKVESIEQLRIKGDAMPRGPRYISQSTTALI